MIDTATSVMEPAVRSGATDAPIAAVAGTGVISRRGLSRQPGHAGRVTLVSAPAGRGQAVLPRSWVCAAALAERPVWVPVQGDRRDQQPFWVSVADALRGTTGVELGRPLTSESWEKPQHGSVYYSAMRAAYPCLARGAARDLAAAGIQVNCISPNYLEGKELIRPNCGAAPGRKRPEGRAVTARHYPQQWNRLRHARRDTDHEHRHRCQERRSSRPAVSHRYC